MKRLLKLSAPVLAIAAMLTLVSFTHAQDEDTTLEGVNLGTHVHGPEIETEDLAGKVVVFEYWGDRCPPCIRAIPHLVEIQEEHSEHLVVVANQVWTRDTDAAKRAWQNAGGNDGISVVNHGAIEGVSVRGVPHSFVFDHEGNLLWRGHPMQPQFAQTIEAAIENLPE